MSATCRGTRRPSPLCWARSAPSAGTRCRPRRPPAGGSAPIAGPTAGSSNRPSTRLPTGEESDEQELGAVGFLDEVGGADDAPHPVVEAVPGAAHHAPGHTAATNTPVASLAL